MAWDETDRKWYTDKCNVSIVNGTLIYMTTHVSDRKYRKSYI